MSGCWVAKWLSQEQKEESLRTHLAMEMLILDQEENILGKIITIDKYGMSFQVLKTKEQLIQLLKKGKPGPVKAKVHTTLEKQMVLGPFEKKRLLIPRSWEGA